MLYLLLASGSTLVLQDAASVSRNPSSGTTDFLDQSGRVVATYAPGEIVSFSHQPIPQELIDAMKGELATS